MRMASAKDNPCSLEGRHDGGRDKSVRERQWRARSGAGHAYDANGCSYDAARHVLVQRSVSGGYKFTSKERDQESGLDDFGARHYGSSLGRFMQPDEFTGGPVDAVSGEADPPGPLPYANIANPQSLNKYGYAYNNPLRFIDPDGHDVKDYILLTSGSNQVPNAPHPEVSNASTLGPQQTATGGFFVLNTQAVFDDGDNPGDYKPIRDAYILGNKEGDVQQTRTGSQENPEKSQITNTDNSQFVYDSPGVSVSGAPRAQLGNGKFDVAFSLSEKNKTERRDFL